jgi:hypothetical protein
MTAAAAEQRLRASPGRVRKTLEGLERDLEGSAERSSIIDRTRYRPDRQALKVEATSHEE